MICSIIVEKRSNNLQDDIFEHNDGGCNSDQICKSDLYQYIQSVTSKWAKAKPKIEGIRSIAGTKKRKWSPEDDQFLRQAILKFGVDNWKNVALIVPGRTGKQCRERWLSHMCPNIVHSEWSLHEDLILIQKQKEVGNKWSLITKFLPGRSTTSIKNRWNYLCRRDIPAHSEEYEKMVNTLSLVQKTNIQENKVIQTIDPNSIENLFDEKVINELSDQENEFFFFS